MSGPPAATTTPRLTHHARLRARQMGVSTKTIKDLIRNPEITYGTEAVVVVQGGGLAAVWDRHDNVVLTVLWRTTKDYVRPDALLRQS